MASYSMFNKHHIGCAARDKSCRTVRKAAIAFDRVSFDLTVFGFARPVELDCGSFFRGRS
jgi:hypothetical protein